MVGLVAINGPLELVGKKWCSRVAIFSQIRSAELPVPVSGSLFVRGLTSDDDDAWGWCRRTGRKCFESSRSRWGWRRGPWRRLFRPRRWQAHGAGELVGGVAQGFGQYGGVGEEGIAAEAVGALTCWMVSIKLKVHALMPRGRGEKQFSRFLGSCAYGCFGGGGRCCPVRRRRAGRWGSGPGLRGAELEGNAGASLRLPEPYSTM